MMSGNWKGATVTGSPPRSKISCSSASPGGTRTRDPQFLIPALYPAELRTFNVRLKYQADLLFSILIFQNLALDLSNMQGRVVPVFTKDQGTGGGTATQEKPNITFQDQTA